MKHLALYVVDAMVLLLQSLDTTIQFYVITTCGDIFFNNLWFSCFFPLFNVVIILFRKFSNDPVKVEGLIQEFIQQGTTVTEPQSLQALALASAKLTQVDSYMQIMSEKDLLRLVHLLHYHYLRK